jgi:hypothetical protein
MYATTRPSPPSHPLGGGDPRPRLNGYGNDAPSDGCKVAERTALSTQRPVGVSANFPLTVADTTAPLFATTTLTMARPASPCCW